MQFTFQAELKELTSADKIRLDDLMTKYSSAKRTAYNLLLPPRKHSIKYVTHHLEKADALLALNWRYCEHAARDAEAGVKSQEELLPLYLADTHDRIREVERKAAASKKKGEKSEKLAGELERLNKRRRILEEHMAEGTIPKVVFGTRKLFIDRAKGKITDEEWKDARDNQVYSIGQANQKGNANVRIEGGRIGINFPEKTKTRQGKGRVYRVRSTRKWFKLSVNESKFAEYTSLLLGGGRAYSVRVLRRSGRYLAHVSVEIAVPVAGTEDGKVCSVDSNPEGFATAVVKRDGNLLAHSFFRDDRLACASQGKRDSIIGGLVAKIVAWAKMHRAEAFVVEDLSIKGHKSFGRKANRVMYTFVRRKFTENLAAKCWKEGFPIAKVNPAYTSKIGDAKYREAYGLSNHEAAAFCIGRRFFGCGEKLRAPMKVRVGRPRERVSMRYVWASLYGPAGSADLRKEPPRRKGSADLKLSRSGQAVFTGRPAGDKPPPSKGDEGERKGGEPGEGPGATGNGVTPAPPNSGGGKVAC